MLRPVVTKTRKNVSHCYSEWRLRRRRWSLWLTVRIQRQRGPEQRPVRRMPVPCWRQRRSAWTNTVLPPITSELDRWPRKPTRLTRRLSDRRPGGLPRWRLWIAMLITHTPSELNTRRRDGNCWVAKPDGHKDASQHSAASERPSCFDLSKRQARL